MSKLYFALGMLLALGAAGCRQSTEKTGTMSESSTTTSATVVPPSTDTKPAAPALPGAPGTGKMHKLASGLQYDDLVVGSGKMAAPGMNVSLTSRGFFLAAPPSATSYD